MIIGILSDTHGFVPNRLLELFEGVDCILHAGDIGNELVLHTLNAVAPTVAVRGNVDEFGIADPIVHITRGNKKITVVHNAGDIIHPARDLYTRVLTEPTDIMISGHYHGWWVEHIQMPDGHPVLWLSPGAAGNSGHHRIRTAMRLTIRDQALQNGTFDDYTLEKIDLGPREMYAGW